MSAGYFPPSSGGGGGGSSSMTPTAVKTGNYTASAGDYVPVDTTSGNVTVTLPTAPVDKAQVGVKQVTRGGTNTVTVACGGSDVLNKSGGSTSGAITLLNQGALFQYKASGAVWYVISDDTPLSQLDARYVAVGNAAPLGNTNPVADGTAAPGTASTAARSDHVHPALASVVPAVLPPVTGWIGMPGAVSSTNSAMPNSSVIYFSPLIIPAVSTWDQIGLRVGTAGTATQVLRMGIYTSDPEGKPSTLVLDAGTLASDSTGTKAITIGSPVQLTTGFYWVATVVQVATTSGASVDFGAHVFAHIASSGNQNSLTATNPGRYKSGSTYAAALPSSITSDLAVDVNSTVPLFQMRRSA